MNATAPRAILTGATGFIGSAVLAELVARGARPLVLVRETSDRRRLASLDGRFEVATFSRLNDPALIPSLQRYQPEVFIHCAWRGVFGLERNAEYQITENLPLTLEAVKLAAACGCRQWIGLGSQAEYGNPNCVLDETAPTRPTTLYGKAKLAAGIAALALGEARGLASTWLRVFSTYGPGDHPQWLVPYVIREFLAGRAPRLTRCEQRWDYLYVTDAARAIAAVAERGAAGVFNLGSGEARPLRQIIEMIKAELGTPIEAVYGAIPYRPDQVMRLQADIAKLKAATGWAPTVSLLEGLRATVARERGNSTANQLLTRNNSP